jgi:hypothetical protein
MFRELRGNAQGELWYRTRLPIKTVFVYLAIVPGRSSAMHTDPAKK